MSTESRWRPVHALGPIAESRRGIASASGEGVITLLQQLIIIVRVGTMILMSAIAERMESISSYDEVLHATGVTQVLDLATSGGEDVVPEGREMLSWIDV